MKKHPKQKSASRSPRIAEVTRKKVLETATMRFSDENSPKEEFSIVAVNPFLDGFLYTVEYPDSDEPYNETCYVYDNGGDHFPLYLDAEDLARAVGRNPRFWEYLSRVGVDGFLAVLITVTFCVAFFANVEGDLRKTMLTVLSGALTTIVGFFFGKMTSK